MGYDSRHLTTLVSHAAHHLHAVVGNVATTLLDVSGTPKMLFSNSALSHVNGSTMVALARGFIEQGCPDLPCLHVHALEEDETVLYFTVLDERHVFVVIGKAKDELRVQDFVERLKGLLPAAAG